MSLPAYEKMGAFYLGRRVKDAAGTPTDETILYDAKDLTTHAMCVGMTGSGKTGLCIGLLEEAAMDGVPAIAIDPKGDLGNLLLTFPDLRPEDFAPWVEEAQAARKGLTVPQYAASVATQWREGLASWGQDGDRIRRLKEAADFAIYTPGSSAGRPLTILRSFAAPPPAVRDDADALRDRVGASGAGLLGLVGVDADPLRSREHILLANLVERAWREGEDLDLGTLILKIQDPGFTRVGVMDLESFFPAKDRFGLAMTLNNLLASPGFASWIEGEPLDVQRLLYTPEGKPRIAIISSQMGSDQRAGGGSYAYRASKAAALNLGRNLAADLRPRGILVGVPQAVDLDELLLVVGDVVLGEDGGHRAGRLAGAAVDALIRVDVEHLVDTLVEVDAVDGAHVHARLVGRVDTRLSNHVGHAGNPFCRIGPPPDWSQPDYRSIGLTGTSAQGIQS